jgi:hypothetical protein
MNTEYTIRHRTLGDVGGFSSHTAATLVAIAIGWPLADWSIEPVDEAPATPTPRSFAPFADLPDTARTRRALERWARA